MVGYGLALGFCLLACPLSYGQAAQPKPDGNPFPGEPQKAPAGQEPTKKPDAAKPAGGDNDNPFPGESSDAPILPVDPNTPESAPAGRADARKTNSDGDGDPVKSPDGGAPAADDGFSSSNSGLTHVPAGDDTETKPGKSAKKKTREQVVKENLDIGQFYIDRKNWRAAQGRFQDALLLDGENADAVWGLAEAERHLNLYDKAAEHYKLFLSYDPDGPHGKAARKALDEVENAASTQNLQNGDNLKPHLK